MNKQVTLAQILMALNRHKLRAFFVFCLVMILVTVGFLLWPRRYGSEGKLFVQLNRAGTSLDPNSGATAVSIQDSRETEIRSVVELVKSRAVIEATVDEVGADPILESPFNQLLEIFEFEFPSLSGEETTTVGGLSVKEYKRLKKREKAAKKLEKSLTIDSEKKTSVISVYCKSVSPDLSQKIVDTMMRLTKEKHLEVHAIKGSTQFFDEEFVKQEKKLDKAIKRLEEFRTQNGFLSADGARTSLQKVIDKLEEDLIDAHATHAQAREREVQIAAKISGMDDKVSVPTSGVEKLSFEDSTTELYKLKAEAQRLRETYTYNHPQVAVVERQIRTLENELRAMTTERTEQVQELNPAYYEVQVELVKAIAETRGAQAKLDDLSAKFASSQKRMLSLNAAKTKSEELLRDIEIAKKYLDVYIQKRGESAVMDELDRQRISDVVVAQPGNFVVKHISPKGSLILPMGAVLAFLSSVATALYSERDFLSGTLREEEIEQALNLPVLVTLPRVSSSRNMVN